MEKRNTSNENPTKAEMIISKLSAINALSFRREIQKLSPYLTSPLLDFGCGYFGFITLLDIYKKGLFIVGYDINPIAIAIAKQNNKFRSNIEFAKSKQELQDIMDKHNITHFGSVFSSFVFHDLKERFFDEISSYINNGYLIIVEHDKKGMGREEFYNKTTEQDLKEIEREGFEKVYKSHTRYSFSDFIIIADNKGYATVFSVSKEEMKSDFFIWVGKRK